ncbi:MULTISPECIES: EF-hand domain-containing protein [Roseobacteraceae]|uniref:EF hand n=1 Tax=Pseudosulfitobacter pseudonitzschiae TaxID=1402135 RepID=A0A221JXV8_9RHOB|nr:MULTISPECIES: EF-hand domain-containing protein [Roseobacteraceae]ASM71568.1 EF hand [Pseudosulfitobacter pseudonitzschiae]
MNSSKTFAFATVVTLGLAAIAVPVVAQQTKMMGGGMGMMGGHNNMGMMMGGAQSHMMAMFDTNEDGTLSPEEMTAGIQAELSTYDTDANGTLSLEEFAVMHAAHTRPMVVRAFQMHDPDGDAQVTEAEMKAMATMMQSHMNEGHSDAHGMGQGMMNND